jgi:hypothetical protein
MFDRIAQWQPDRGAAVAARTVGALALIALAVIHVVDLPGTLGPDRLVGIGYLEIIAAAVLLGGVLLVRSNWLAWGAAAAVAVSAMGGYILTRALPGGFLGDHGDIAGRRSATAVRPPPAGPRSARRLGLVPVRAPPWPGSVPAAPGSARARRRLRPAAGGGPGSVARLA